jgi:hypothetical protein
MEKRGLSQVVTTVLIILIVIAAISIIWTAVRPAIQSAGEQITADCFSINLEVVSCVDDTSVTVKRNTGKGDLQGLKFILEDGASVVDLSDSTVTVATGSKDAPGELETKTYLIGGSTTFSDADITAVVGDQKNICEPSGTPVDCDSPTSS